MTITSDVIRFCWWIICYLGMFICFFPGQGRLQECGRGRGYGWHVFWCCQWVAAVVCCVCVYHLLCHYKQTDVVIKQMLSLLHCRSQFTSWIVCVHWLSYCIWDNKVNARRVSTITTIQSSYNSSTRSFLCSTTSFWPNAGLIISHYVISVSVFVMKFKLNV